MNIAIVGNSVNQLKNKDGLFIDSCDKVIRFNGFNLEGKESALGTKIDIHSMIGLPNEYGVVGSSLHLENSFKKVTVEYLKKCNEIWAVTPGHGPIEIAQTNTYYKDLLGEEKVIKFPFQQVDYLTALEELLLIQMSLNYTQPKLIPSSGFMVVRKIVNEYPTANIYLFGFDPLCLYGMAYFSHASDGLRNDYHGHPYVSEGLYYLRLQAQNRIHLK